MKEIIRFAPSLGFRKVDLSGLTNDPQPLYPPPGAAMIGDSTRGTSLGHLLGTTDVAFVRYEEEGQNASVQLNFSLPLPKKDPDTGLITPGWKPPLTLRLTAINLGALGGTARFKVWTCCPGPRDLIQEVKIKPEAGIVIDVTLPDARYDRDHYVPGLYRISDDVELDVSTARQTEPQAVCLIVRRERNIAEDTFHGAVGISEYLVAYELPPAKPATPGI